MPEPRTPRTSLTPCARSPTAEPGVIGAVLTSPKVSAELIADGVHVDEAAMRVLIDSKTPERVILVSDGTSATGMPDGKYHLGMFEVTVSGGVCRNAEGKLAGSTLTLDRALRNIVALGIPLPSALRMVTANPARQIGLARAKGSSLQVPTLIWFSSMKNSKSPA